MKKDILINASILEEHNGGLGVYTYQLLGHLPAELERRGLSYDIMCTDAVFLPESVRDRHVPVSFKGFVSRSVNTSRRYTRDYGLVWSTTQHGGILARTKQVITIHDVTPLIYPEGRKQQYFYYKYLDRHLIKRSSLVFTMSQNTKEDILRFYDVEPEKVCVAYEAMDLGHVTESDFAPLADSYGIADQRYFIVVGINYEYKNITAVIEAFAQPDFLEGRRLVIVGNDRCAYAQELKALVAQLGCSHRVVFTGFVSDEDKASLMRHAIAEVYPTLYEGFGLPVLEAMTMGVPVVCSDRSSLPEVGGDAPVYFDPTSTTALREALARVEGDAELRREMVERGVASAARFSWPRIVGGMVDQVARVLEGVEP